MTRTIRRRLADESGVSIVEILVAMLILAIGLLAVLGSFDAAKRNTFRAEQSQVATNRAQAELESIRHLSWDQVAMNTTPAHSTDTSSPFNRVTGGNFLLNDTHAQPNNAQMVVDNAGGGVAPGGTPWSSGDISGKVYRFVVWQNDPQCLVLCPGSQDYKRVIVIVTLNNVPVTYNYGRPYVEVQSNFADPGKTSVTVDDPGSTGNIVTAQQFYLSDTPCNQSSASNPSADHLVHDTVSTSSGVLGGAACSSTGSGAKHPDGLYSNAPADPDPNDPSNPVSYDYATDSALEPSPDTSDRGLQLLRQDSNGCAFSGGASNPQYKVHRWLSQPVPLAFVMSGGTDGATLDLYTRTIGDVNIPGKICVWLFTRTETTVLGTTTVTDAPLIDLSNAPNTYFTLAQASWPHTAWTRVKLTFNIAPKTLLLGQRLGLALSVERQNTPQDALEFMYDHPDYPSRLEVQTTTPF